MNVILNAVIPYVAMSNSNTGGGGVVSISELFIFMFIFLYVIYAMFIIGDLVALDEYRNRNKKEFWMDIIIPFRKWLKMVFDAYNNIGR